MSDMVGKKLVHYEILGELGAGGMGEVYLAEDSKLGRQVALKVLPPDMAADPERLERFQREARALASLSHPNIVHIYSVEEAEGLHFFTMEVVRGESLDKILPSGGFPLETFFQLAVPLAEALSAAHDRGVTHRDLKPSNLLVTEDERRIKIVDFGLAKLAPEQSSPLMTQLPTEAVTAEGRILGTAPYMSPEQVEGKPVDHRTDVFSMGVVLYGMATGQHPFQGDSSPSLISSILKDNPPPLIEVNRRLPRQLGRIIHRCLEKEPLNRFQSARDLYNDLRDLAKEIETDKLLGGSDSAADSSQTGPSPTSTRGLPWKLALPAGLALFLLGAAAMWLAGSREAPQPTRQVVTAWDERPLTATGDAWNVALAPDGQTVAYLTSEGLMTQDVQGGNPHLILSDSGWATRNAPSLGPMGEPQWLADGSGVAFTVSIDSSTLGISALPRMGGEVTPKVVTSFTGGEVEASFQSLPGGGFLLARPLEDRSAAPWIRWLEEGAEKGVDLAPDIEDLWDAVASPDGRWIAYIGERADRSNLVGTISRDGSRHNVIAEGGTELSKWAELSLNRLWAGHRIMRWPSGNRVYYRQLSARGVDLYGATIDPGSGKALGDPELVYSGLPPGASFDVALDGTRLVFSGGLVKTQIRLFRFDVNRGGDPVEERQITRGTARHVAPRFSPDGTQLAYIRKTGRSEDIYVAPVSGGEARPLRPLYSWDQLVDLKWSPDGERLAVYALTPGGPKLVLVSLSDSRVTGITTQPLRSAWFDWSPDGRWIAYGTESDATYVLHQIDSGEEREFFEDVQGEKIQALFSADSTELLLNNIGVAQPGLWAQRLDGGPARLVTAEAGLRTYPVRWSRDGTIHLFDPEGTSFTLEGSGGTPRVFGRIPEAPIWEGWASIWIDGASLYLACAIGEPRESDVWVLDQVEGDAL
jgi:serine/threonine protein kinase/Tol biopolymer transport system component